MNDLRKKYNLARRAKNQANYRARKEREWAAMSWQNSQTWIKTAADAKAQALTAEREARAARDALRAGERNIERQNMLLAELQRELSIARGQLEDALAREAKGNNGTERLNDLRMRLKEARKNREEALQLTAANKSALHERDKTIEGLRRFSENDKRRIQCLESQVEQLEKALEIERATMQTYKEEAYAKALRDTKPHDVPPMTQRHARECARQARIEPHARPWWQRLVWWPKSDGSR